MQPSAEDMATMSRLLTHAEKQRILAIDAIQHQPAKDALHKLAEFIEAVGYVKFARDSLPPLEARQYGRGLKVADKTVLSLCDEFEKRFL